MKHEPRTDGTKRCRLCRAELPRVQFGICRNNLDGRLNVCHQCERVRSSRAKHGMSREEKTEQAKQQGGCLICHRKAPGEKGWVMDHDRSCCPGDRSCERCRRGVLCQWCNNALGYAMDSPDLLRAMADYLDAHANRICQPHQRAASASRISEPHQRAAGARTEITDGLRAEAHADRRNPAATLRAGARTAITPKGKTMTDPSDRAIRAIIHAINVNGGDATWTAHAILGALRGLGWRPTQIEPAPGWRHRDVTPAPPTAAYLAARPPSTT